MPLKATLLPWRRKIKANDQRDNRGPSPPSGTARSPSFLKACVGQAPGLLGPRLQGALPTSLLHGGGSADDSGRASV